MPNRNLVGLGPEAVGLLDAKWLVQLQCSTQTPAPKPEDPTKAELEAENSTKLDPEGGSCVQGEDADTMAKLDSLKAKNSGRVGVTIITVVTSCHYKDHSIEADEEQ
ncbi:hypothetical protein B0H14DRAFT_2615964 [Mycena olivaceomarginata]|nr:hypothetical protein B0H14DRAFT_2615964 [Mycena olivaceomarginata]